MNFFNFFFCCCFNPFPVYIFKNNQTLSDLTYNNINWVYEGILNKYEFLYKKHRISYFRLWLNRILVTLLIFFILYIFPSLLFFAYSLVYLSFNFKLLKEKPTFDYLFVIADVLITLIPVIGIIIYSKLDFNIRYICFVFVFIFAILFLLLVIGFFLIFHLNVIEYKSTSTTSSE